MSRGSGQRRSETAAAPGDDFRFDSPGQELDWHRQAYRQSVDPDRWQQQPPVDHQTQSLLDGMPHLASGEFFRGPDGKHRRITAALREDRDIADIRRRAFNDLARSGVTWHELAQYPEDKPHPGEAEALALREKRRAAAAATNPAAVNEPLANQAHDRFGPAIAQPDLTRVAPDLGLDLGGGDAGLGIPSEDPAPAPVLVATTDRALAGLPKEVEKVQPFVTPSRLTSGQRRSFNERLVGHPANDNHRPAVNDNSSSAAAPSTAVQPGTKLSEQSPGVPAPAAGNTLDTEADWQVSDRLFNWSRNGKSAPAPHEYAVNAVSEEGRFTYLEEMKDEWSRLLEQNPDKVYRSMAAEVDKLSNAAMQDFVAAHHRQPNPAEKTEIKDAVANMVFAPAEHWTTSGGKPNEKVTEAKPFLGIAEPAEMPSSELAGVFSQAAKIIAEGKVERFGGRPGSKETRSIIARAVQKLAKAIEACGGKVTTKLYGPNEKFLPSGQAKGGSFADKFLEYTYNGRTLGIFGNHSATYADGVTLKPNEAQQIHKLVANIARGMFDGSLEIDAAGVGYFSKRKRGQSMKEYLRTVNDFVKKMIDCKRPFLIKIRLEKSRDRKEFPHNDNTGQ